MRSETNRKRLYLAIADNKSRSIACELARELGYEVFGESGYINEIVGQLQSQGFDSVLCSERLLDGSAKQLCNAINERGGDSHRVFVLSRVNNRVLKLGRLARRVNSCTHSLLPQTIKDTLSRLQIPSSRKGYSLLYDALIITTASPQSLCDITNKVYLQLAKTHNTSKDCVEHNMRFAKNRSWNSSPLDTLYEIFGESTNTDNKPPQLSEYLSKLTAYINKICR